MKHLDDYRVSDDPTGTIFAQNPTYAPEASDFKSDRDLLSIDQGVHTLDIEENQVNIAVVSSGTEQKVGPDFRISFGDIPYEAQIPKEYPRLV